MPSSRCVSLPALEDIRPLLANLNDSNKFFKPPVELKLGDRVFIIQHPRGLEQQIVLSDNNIIPNGLYRNFLRYLADSDYGSSGSPVFNERWQLIALHHAAIGEISPEYIAETTASTQASNTPIITKSSESNKSIGAKIYAQQGVRICRIVADLKEKSLSLPKLRSFIEDFVVTAEQVHYPPLPSGLEFDGLHSYVGVDGEVALSFAGTSQSGEVSFNQWSKGELPLTQLEWPIAEGVDAKKGVWFSADDQMFVRAVGNYSLELCKSTGEVIATLSGHQGPVTSVSFSPRGDLIASGSKDKTVKLWANSGQQRHSFDEGEVLATLSGHQGPITCVCFSPKGDLIASGSEDKTVKLWANSGQQHHSFNEIAQLPNGNQPVAKLFVGADRQIAAINTISQPMIWTETQKPLILDQASGNEAKHSKDIFFSAFSPNGETFVTASKNKLKLWKRQQDWAPINVENVNALSFTATPKFSPDGNLIAAVDVDVEQDNLKFWDLEGNPLKEISHQQIDNSDSSFSLASLGSDIILACTQGTSISLSKLSWDEKRSLQQQPIGTFPKYNLDLNGIRQGHSADDSPSENKNLVVVKYAKKNTYEVCIFDSAKEKIIQDEEISTSNKWLIDKLSEFSSGEMVSDQTQDELISKIMLSVGYKNQFTHVRLSQDGQFLLTVHTQTSQKRKVLIWHLNFNDSGEIFDKNSVVWTIIKDWKIPEGNKAVRHFRLSSKAGKSFVAFTQEDSGKIYLWDYQNKDTPTELEHGKGIKQICFSPDGLHLVSSDEENIKLWDVNGGTLLKNFDKVSDCLVFSPDGKKLAFSQRNNSVIQLWNLQSEKLDTIEVGDSNVIGNLSFSPDSTLDQQLLAIANNRGMIRLWNLQQHALQKTLGYSFREIITSTDEEHLIFMGGDVLLIWSLHWKTLDHNKPFFQPFQLEEHKSETFALDAIVGVTKESSEKPIGFNSSISAANINGRVQILRQQRKDTFVTVNPLSLAQNQGQYRCTYLKLNPQHSNLKYTDDPYSFVSESKQSFCIEAWVNPASDGFGGTIISKWKGGKQGEYRLRLTADGTVIFSRLGIPLNNASSSPWVYDLKSSSPLPINQFSHIAATCIIDGNRQCMKLYINGKIGAYVQPIKQENFVPLHQLIHDSSVNKLSWNGKSLRTISGQVRQVDINNVELVRVSKKTKEWLFDSQPLMTEKIVSKSENVDVHFPLASGTGVNNYLKDSGYSNRSDETFISKAKSHDNKWQASLQGYRLILQSKINDDNRIEHSIGVTKSIIIFSPDSQWLAFSVQSTIKVWNFTRPTATPFTLGKHNNGIIDLKFSPNSKYLASAARQDEIVKVWDLEALVFEMDNIPDTKTPVLIGASFREPHFGESLPDMLTDFFKGRIAEVRIWATDRSPEEIQRDLYRRLRGDEKHLIGYWRLEEGAGDRIKNLAKQKDGELLIPANGKIFNAKWFNAMNFPSVPFSFSQQFDGKDDYVNCGDVPQIDNAITVEAWVKHISGSGLIVYRGGSWSESGYSLFWHRNKIRVELQNISEKTKLTIDTQKNAPTDNAWHHIAFTWTEKIDNKTIQEVEIYIDGRRQNVIAITGNSKSILSGGLYKNVGLFEGPIGAPTTTDAKEQSESLPLTIGGLEAKNLGNKQKSDVYFDGEIAEVRLWKHARTQNEIKANLYRRLDVDIEVKNHLIGYWRLDDSYKLSLMSVKNIDELPLEGRDLVIVAKIGSNYHIRIFDRAGTRVFDKSEEISDSILANRLEKSFLKKVIDPQTKQNLIKKIAKEVNFLKAHNLVPADKIPAAD